MVLPVNFFNVLNNRFGYYSVNMSGKKTIILKYNNWTLQNVLTIIYITINPPLKKF